MGKTTERSTAKELYMAGKNQKDIARLVKTTEKTISNWVAKYGWKQEREARFIGKQSQEENLRKLISQLAAKAIRLENEMDIAQKVDDTDKVLSLETELNRVSNRASQWNKQLEAVAKENAVSLATYINVMEQVFNSVREYSPRLYMETVDFQNQHLTDISLKLG